MSLHTLQVNKTVIYNTPLQDKKPIVRTGIIGDGNCFFHAVSHACSRDYIFLSIDERKTSITKLRNDISLTKKDWEKLSNGMVAAVSYQEHINKIMTQLYSNIQNNHEPSNLHRKLILDKQDTTVVELLFDIIPLSIYEKKIFAQSFNNVYSIEKINVNLLSNTVSYFNTYTKKYKNSGIEKQLSLCYNKLTQIIEEVLKTAYENAYNEYISSVKEGFVGDNIIKFLSDHFDRDIYFIDGNTSMPYQNTSKDYIKNRKSIILLWFNSHYEVVGELLDKNKILRDFDTTHPVILKIKTFLLTPEKIHSDYPSLVKFLPNQYRRSSLRPTDKLDSKTGVPITNTHTFNNPQPISTPNVTPVSPIPINQSTVRIPKVVNPTTNKYSESNESVLDSEIKKDIENIRNNRTVKFVEKQLKRSNTETNPSSESNNDIKNKNKSKSIEFVKSLIEKKYNKQDDDSDTDDKDDKDNKDEDDNDNKDDEDDEDDNDNKDNDEDDEDDEDDENDKNDNKDEDEEDDEDDDADEDDDIKLQKKYEKTPDDYKRLENKNYSSVNDNSNDNSDDSDNSGKSNNETER